MAVIPMQKIRLAVHRSESSDVLRAIQKLGEVEFTPMNIESLPLAYREKSAFEFNYVSSRLDFVVTFLSDYEAPKGALRSMFEGNRVLTSGSNLYKTVNSFHYNEIIESAQDIQEKLNETRARIEELEAEQVLLTDWKGLTSALSTPRETTHTTTLYLQGDPAAIHDLTNQAESVQHPTHVTTYSEATASITFISDDRESVEKLLQDNSIEIVDLPLRRGTPTVELERIERAIKKHEHSIIQLEKKARILAKHLPKLKMVADYMHWSKNKHNLISQSVMSADTLMFEGWAPKNKLADLKRRIENKTSFYSLEAITPAEDEIPPVEIENNRLVKPFESVTRLYGLPGPKDLDPTLFLAGFFFIFFGLSLTDVGYGLILFAATASILTFYNVPKETKPLITLIMFGGIASTIIGLIFGGYFGIDMSIMPAWLQALQAFDPIKNPIPVFYLALGFGVVQILFGLTLSIVSSARNGEVITGILDKGPWITLFLSLGLWGANMGGIIGGESTYYVYLIYAVLVSLVLTQGRREKSLFAKLAKGVLSLYDSISYFSDILSYSRLLALGLATSALAFAVNLIASMVQDVPYVGFILMVIILIIGHVFNLAVNVLGAFIHSARLQFVEFFGKFITGTGRNFKPFKRNERYVVIDNK